VNRARIPALTALSLLMVLAACAGAPPSATTGPPNKQLASLANVLWRNARVMATRADGMGDRAFSDDAQAFEQHALEFRDAAASSRASDSELQDAFDDLSSSYESLQADVKTLDKTQATSALELVSGPYQGVAALMAPPRSGL
jgi:hypothetical protein